MNSEYARASNPFFSNDQTPKAVVDLAKAEKLTIYCGAGVTIDRTGLGWGDLIFELLKQLCDHTSSNDLTEEEAIHLRDTLSPLDLSSIYEQYAEDAGLVNPHVPILQQKLYKGTVWKSGVLVRNVVRLAVGLTVLGKSITVITTNYDTYLEDELFAYLRKFAPLGRVCRTPGFVVRCLGVKDPIRRVPSIHGGGVIEIVYVHGRVPPKDNATGTLVVSERNYHSVRSAVTRRLTASFDGSSILILGASLTDPPLLASLHATRDRAPSGGDPGRYALMPASATGLTKFGKDAYPRLGEHFAQRMNRYGVELLMPDFNSQIAQFCQEILTCAEMGADLEKYACASPKAPERYGERLCAWWDRWIAGEVAGDHDKIHSTLIARLEELKSIKTWGKDPNEVYKLELWVRYLPRENGTRRLALWGGSMGILSDRKILKFEDIELTTDNASVRSFIEGKPVWLDRADRDKPEVSPRRRQWILHLGGRWDRYLAVPIRLDADNDPKLTVGIVTLAAMRAKNGTNIPMKIATAAESVVRKLTDVGQELLRP
ncbi:SIR2 family protein [Nocardia sp. NPDC003482]